MISIWNKNTEELYLPLGESGFPEGYDRLLSCIDFTDGEYPQYCCFCNERISLKSLHPLGNNPNPITPDGRCCDVCDNEKVLPKRIDNIKGVRCSSPRSPYKSHTFDEFVGWGRGGIELRSSKLTDDKCEEYRNRMKDNLKELSKEINVVGLLEWSSNLFQSIEDYLEEGKKLVGERSRRWFPHTIVDKRKFIVFRHSFYVRKPVVMVKEIQPRL